ncbi:MAG: phenylalanine--tRNA ligase beta subunit-related protein [Sulfolobales archaeon]
MIAVRGLPEVPVVYSICRNVEVKTTQVDIIIETRGIVMSIKRSTDSLALARDPIISKYKPFVKKYEKKPAVRVYPEVLIRRILSAGSIPRYNSVLDIVNAVSALTKVPISSIDIDRVKLPLKLVYSTKDTTVKDFRGRSIYIARGTIVLEEDSGRIVYVFPYTITDVAAINTGTKNAIFVGYGAPGVPINLVTSSIKMVTTRIENFMRGSVCSQPEVNAG